MRLKVYSFFILLLSSLCIYGQHTLSGTITDQSGVAVADVELYLREASLAVQSSSDGTFSFKNIPSGTYNLVVFGYAYELVEEPIVISKNTIKDYKLKALGGFLSEVVLSTRREKVFALRTLKKVEGTAIYAGKKSEVVVLDQLTANLAANAPRQIYSQVVGLNIYENGDAGLQLNIGGRGLDPNRSSNFNIRQNNYDISADVLGYPESYYTPPAEALEEIQVIRGAASLQYGTQFGGLINFKLRRPEPTKKIELVSRQTAGSFGLLTSFNSLSGTVGKFSYYTYLNYKEGNGWRDNSRYNSRNYYAHLGYQLSPKTKIEGELTLFNYLAQQAGGLTDAQFEENPNFSNRARNWFDIDWKVYSLRLEHEFTPKTEVSLNLFGLDASRSAVGFRDNRVSQPDENGVRELLVDNFGNWGVEGRFLTRYDLGKQTNVLLLGSKYYDANNSQRQGPGSDGSDANFIFDDQQFPNFERQADFDFPNRNIAIFGENIFNVNDRFALTPGFRWEYIKTESEGEFLEIGFLLDNETVDFRNELEDNRIFERNFVLLGLGASYKASSALELYGNFSQNFRSVTFSDIRVVNPSFVIDENISDEDGYTIDFGGRGALDNKLSYDVSIFGLRYDNRLGEVLFEDTDGSIKRRRGNIGDAFIYGLEFFTDWNIKNTFFEQKEHFKTSAFVNLAYTRSEYLESDATNVTGNKVEFLPEVNLKTGVNFGYKNFTSSIQYTYLTEQFTDATNAARDITDNQRGIEGAIPAYGVLDLSAAYTYKRWRLETGINNLLDNEYFTRRATGYPGPGIIPAEPLTFYTTLQYKL